MTSRTCRCWWNLPVTDCPGRCNRHGMHRIVRPGWLPQLGNSLFRLPSTILRASQQNRKHRLLPSLWLYVRKAGDPLSLTSPVTNLLEEPLSGVGDWRETRACKCNLNGQTAREHIADHFPHHRLLLLMNSAGLAALIGKSPPVLNAWSLSGVSAARQTSASTWLS